ncbi:hypothetical protein P692DRAFT_20279263 [Suillus brevipes Sb2]|nr:hypothetical protein P692DRAFT_20279263 [Suillus brevipes Sb2]
MMALCAKVPVFIGVDSSRTKQNMQMMFHSSVSYRPNDSFFDVPNQAGAYWYHNYHSTQQCDGLRSLLVIYDFNNDQSTPCMTATMNLILLLSASSMKRDTGCASVGMFCEPSFKFSVDGHHSEQLLASRASKYCWVQHDRLTPHCPIAHVAKNSRR